MESLSYNIEADIIKGVKRHYDKAMTLFARNNIIGCFLAGSQNYGLATENSDIDTKLLVIPTFRDFMYNKPAYSSTYNFSNGEQMDIKDVRLYIDTFRKQNVNFLEILFTNYFIVNSQYDEDWNELKKYRENIARMDITRAIASMYGIACNKYRLFKSHYDDDNIKRANKEFSSLYRIEEFLVRYYDGEPYVQCLKSKKADFIKNVKINGAFNDEYAEMAYNSMNNCEKIFKQSQNSVFDDDDNYKIATEALNKFRESVMLKSIEHKLF